MSKWTKEQKAEFAGREQAARLAFRLYAARIRKMTKKLDEATERMKQNLLMDVCLPSVPRSKKSSEGT